MDKRLFIPLLYWLGISFALKSWELPEFGLSSLVTEGMDQEWILFKKIYNKTYVDRHEELRRRLYWEDTLRFIQEHNLKYDRGESTYSLGENEFADMAEDEFEKIYMKGRTIPETNDDESYLSACHNAPSEFDWRTHGYVSPVKSQEVTCRGGPNVVAVYKYIQENGGIDSAACYHSSTSKQKCHYNKSCKAAKCNGYKWVKKNEDSLKCSLVSVGPIAVSLDVNHRSFWLYKNGIWYNPRCSKDRPNHVMLAVGYGTESKGMDYWIIKNSWGTSWGKQGYVFTSRNRNNMCGVASNATYPTV